MLGAVELTGVAGPRGRASAVLGGVLLVGLPLFLLLRKLDLRLRR